MTRARRWLNSMLEASEDAEGDLSGKLAENLEYLLDHVDEWEAGEIREGDLPHFGDEVQAVIVYSVLFGTLWELSHPSIWAVMQGRGELIGLYGHEHNARDRAADHEGWFVERMGVADGDKPPEAIVDGIPGGGGEK